MRGLVRDAVLFIACVVVPCTFGWLLEEPTGWRWTHGLGAGLFVTATLMVFTGLRLLLTPPVPALPPPPRSGGAAPRVPAPAPAARIRPATSEIIHVEPGAGSARVVALLRLGEGPHDVHLLELDIVGEDLRPEVIEEAVAGVASGEPSEEPPPIDRVGYAAGWGLTLPCPPLEH
jgi:hypothetical protein